MRLLVVGLLFVGALGVFIWIGVAEGSVPVLKLEDLQQMPKDVCRIDGSEVAEILSAAAPLRFKVRSVNVKSATLLVESKRNAPDNFKVGSPVSIKGVFNQERGLFVADEVQTQCPSREYAAGKAAESAKGAAPAYSAPATDKVPAPEKGLTPEKGP